MTELLVRVDDAARAEVHPEIDEELVCRRVVPITHDVTSFVLESPRGRHFGFRAGQYVTLAATVHGHRIERCYTISSPSTRTELLTITVKRVVGGPMSNWLHDHLAPGDRMQVTGPLGEFTTLDHPAPKYLFLSAGSGITPLMSMTRTLQEQLAPKPDVVFVHSARSPEDIVFRSELEVIGAGKAGVRVAAICETDSPHERWAGPRGRLTRPMLRAVAPDLHDREVFTCGPPPYMDAVRDILERAGVDPARCHEESFLLGRAADGKPTPPGPAASTTTAGFTVEFRRSRRVIECDADTSILDAALGAGLTLPSSCGEGVCGTCKSSLLSGRVDMRPAGGIRAREIVQDKILLCCSKPLENLVIDV
ncbi:MAG: FAD-binding oxidoreductase [Jatrophihabitans sp.]